MKTKDYKWFNDGKKNYRCLIEDADQKWIAGRLTFWTDETTQRMNATKDAFIASGGTYKKKKISPKSIEQARKNFRDSAKRRHEERIKKILESPFINGIYTRKEYLSNKEVNTVHSYLLEEKKKCKPKFCECCGLKKDLVLHHKDEKTAFYGQLDKETEWLCKSCHAKVHSTTGWHTEESKLAIKNTVNSKEYREKHSCKITCYETQITYLGMKKIDEAGFVSNKVWCCANSSRQFINGKQIIKNGTYTGRKRSGGLHWFFEGEWDEKLLVYWNTKTDYSWRHKNQYS